MYLLSYRTSEEFRSKLERKLTDNELRPLIVSDQIDEVKESLKALDPGFEASVSSRTKAVLREISGKEPLEPYSSSTYGKPQTATLCRDVGRAMVLADREFGFLDEISLNITRKILDNFSGQEAEFSILNKGYGDDWVEYAKMDWTYFRTRVLRGYTLPGSEGFSPSGKDSSDLELILHTAKGNVQLGITINHMRSRLFWYARGLSAVKKSHRKLVDELNRALEDYASRLSWMEQYRSTPPKPGLSSADIARVRSALKVFFKEPFDLPMLEGGISFGPEPLILESGQSRVYFARCTVCEKIISAEVMTNYSYSSSIDWTDPEFRGRTAIEGMLNEQLIGPDHGRTSLYSSRERELYWSKRIPACEGRSVISSRTGKVTPLDY